MKLQTSIVLGTSYAIAKLATKRDKSIKMIARELSNAKKYDIIMSKLSEIMNKEDLNSFVEELIKNGIKKGTEPLWAE